VIVTVTAPDGSVTETCGTPELPCRVRASVTHVDQNGFWQSVLEALKLPAMFFAAGML